MWERIAEDDPRRCQAVMPTIGQCLNKAVEGSNYCYAHGGNKGEEAKKRRDMNNYRLAKYKQQRAEELSSSDKITSLKDEIALLRILIEERWNRCTNAQELLLSSGPLSDLVMKCKSVTETCYKLDTKLGNLLDRNKILQFAQVIVEILSKHVTDEVILESMSNEIFEALENL